MRLSWRSLQQDSKHHGTIGFRQTKKLTCLARDARNSSVRSSGRGSRNNNIESCTSHSHSVQSCSLATFDAFWSQLNPRSVARLLPETELRTQYYVNLDVADRPGVLAAVAKVFGDNGVSIRSMEQVGLDDEARLMFLTHVAREGDVHADARPHWRELTWSEHVGGVLRVIGDDGDGDVARTAAHGRASSRRTGSSSR